MQVHDRPPAGLRMMADFFLEGCRRLPAAAAYQDRVAIARHRAFVYMPRDEDVWNFRDDQRILFIVRNVERGGMRRREMALLEQELHREVGSVIASARAYLVDFRDVVIKTISMVEKNIKPWKGG